MSEPTSESACQDCGSVQYRPIPGFPGYRVGDDGTVWTSRKPGAGYGLSKAWTKMKPTPNTNGRLAVGLCRDKKPYRRQVHCLVMLAFVGPCPDGMECCHDDGDHLDNRIGNLRYDTHINNESDKERHGTKLLGDRHPVAKLNADKVRAIKLALAVPPCHGVVARLAGEYVVDEAIIARIRDGKAWRWVE